MREPHLTGDVHAFRPHLSMDSQLEGTGITQLLDSDPRPTFVVALGSRDGPSPREISYRNTALVANRRLLEAVQEIPRDDDHATFWSWAAGPSSSTQTDPGRSAPRTAGSKSHLGFRWTRSIILGQWAVLSGTDLSSSPERRHKIRLEGVLAGGATGKSPSSETSNSTTTGPAISDDVTDRKARDLFHTEPDPGLVLPDFGPDTEPFLHVIQSVDWNHHPLGPMDEWPLRLHQAFNQTIPDSRAIAIYWGPEYRAIYNEAFSKLCGSKHPGLLGESILQVFPYFKQFLDHLRYSPAHSRPKKIEDESRFFVEQADGSLEETYVRWSLSPIVENRQVVGMQHSLLDMTSMRLWERRMKMLVDLGDNLVTARDVESYWIKILDELQRWSPAYDVPLAFIYSVNEDDDSDSAQSRYDCPRTCRLAGSLGVPRNHPIAPSILELRDTDQGLAPRFREALKAQVALLIHTKDGGLPEKHLKGLEWRGFGDPCQAAVILPIRPTKDENIMGILFLGLNPRRPYDNDYRQFISLLNQKLTSSLASTVLLEEEARRGRNAAAQAAYDTAVLQKKLAWQTEQANQSIQNFKAVAEFIPVGMSFVDNHGNVTFANDAWYRLTGYPMGRIDRGALLECVIPEDKPKILEAYEKLKEVDTVTFEFRIPKERIDPDGSTAARLPVAEYDERVGRHILASAKADRDEAGDVIRMLTCLTDVTNQKDTAEVATRRAQEAENLKRLAEFATVGMCDVSLDGRLLSVNDSFWELSGLPKVDPAKVSLEPWQACVVEEDLPVLHARLAELRERGLPQSAEIRLKTTWTAEDSAGNTIAAARSVLATFMPVKSSEGVIQSFTGCISDVSLQKWQLERERRRKEEAIESKRQQENFIDMTSHEMRNPLSAIIHCTEAIIASLSRVQDLNEEAMLTPLESPDSDVGGAIRQGHSSAAGGGSEGGKLLKDAIDHAETIEMCAQHQKRVVDDILTMSKLDSKLLAVTPCTVNPIRIAEDALKMFEAEARRVDIALTSAVDPSYTALGYDYLDLDPSRVKQVLINLLTNALKFTKSGKVRNVKICLKGCRAPPGLDMTTAAFIPRFTDPADDYEQPALKNRRNPVYLLFEVMDTGQGLSDEEKGNLFNKFVQASAKTHVKYGGSGLGLFISRRLTELQNGAIGVSSQQGVGSTFAFYVAAYVPSEASRREAEKAAAAAAAVVRKVECDVSGPGGRNETGEPRANGGWREERIHRRLHASENVSVDGILIVEDNLINQHVTRRGLSSRGYVVDVANHGVEAQEKLRRAMGANAATAKKAHDGQPAADDETQARASTGSQPIPINLVLMDVEMPVQDGLTCTRSIRQLEAGGAVFCASGGRMPIIAVTANARPEQVAEARLAGCDDVLVKPYRIPELIEKMQLVVQRLRGDSGPTSPAD